MSKKADMPMLKLKLKLEVPEAAYNSVVQWAKDNELPGTIEEALAIGAQIQFARMHLESLDNREGLVDVEGDLLKKSPGGASDA